MAEREREREFDREREIKREINGKYRHVTLVNM